MRLLKILGLEFSENQLYAKQNLMKLETNNLVLPTKTMKCLYRIGLWFDLNDTGL